VFFFLPGPHQHGEIMLPDERYDLRLYLANRGVETWTLDYRTHFVTREQIYESAFMRSWTTEAFVEDVAVAAHFVRETSGAQMIFVGGFDRGATFAYLYAARHWRENRLGLIILDGYVLNPPDASLLYRQRTPTPEWFADDLEGRYMPYKRWMKILQDIIDDPSGPDFLPVSVFANRAEALAHFLYVNENFGGQGGLSNAKESYADVSILARILRHQDRYWPREQNHGGFEFERHLANVEFDYKTALREMNVPILAFTGGNIGLEWEERVEYSARVTATKDVQYQVLLHWGHLDVLFGNYAAQEVFRPVSDWMARHTPALTPAVVSR
jgi:pimeloyl-ACP methyl ester carboxylesterase